jgi:hypothetical protein
MEKSKYLNPKCQYPSNWDQKTQLSRNGDTFTVKWWLFPQSDKPETSSYVIRAAAVARRICLD